MPQIPVCPTGERKRMVLSGRVVELRKALCVVDTDHGRVEAELKGILKRRDRRPVAGDNVEVRMPDAQRSRGLVTAVEPRSVLLKRPAVANVDRVLLVTTLTEPYVDRTTIDRYLVCVEAHGLETVLVFNKLDLLSRVQTRELEETMGVYRGAGYQVAGVSATERTGMDRLLQLTGSGISTMAGVSGVGKSTLLNAMLPGRELPTAEVSRKTSRGVHTTSTTILLRLGDGSYVADTPGFTAIDLPDIDSRDVLLYFPELKAAIGACRFNNCLHQDEPGCVVKQRVDDGDVASSRYHSYLLFVSELAAREKRRPEARDE
jgi:ribosome biogenesis GTPase